MVMKPARERRTKETLKIIEGDFRASVAEKGINPAIREDQCSAVERIID